MCQKNAVPFVDKDPISVIESLTDFYEAHHNNSTSEPETAVGVESLPEQAASPRRFAAT
jgi:hypothetical protein